ncbi:IS5/IS1182 family transposase [Streptantibioticus cattleyicolor]|uniref:IS5/IS1182 family transposase n=1 Tax=Streptantibioticus cattleyicolor TaxID=29303 RepID=UPI000213F534|nr:protein of unknown function [Streptantibioticus cattleyicolor NRRL 8057 = DSM 46488]
MCVCSCKPSSDSSLTDAQWAVIGPLLAERDPCRGGRPLEFPRRLVVDTVLYALVSGCAWRLVRHDLVPWDAACRWFLAWTVDGTWGRVHDALRERVRAADDRDPQPSAAVSHSPSARSHQGGQAIGHDAGKRVRGRKRHLLVDTCGRVLRTVVHPASMRHGWSLLRLRPGGPLADGGRQAADRPSLNRGFGTALCSSRAGWPSAGLAAAVAGPALVKPVTGSARRSRGCSPPCPAGPRCHRPAAGRLRKAARGRPEWGS